MPASSIRFDPAKAVLLQRLLKAWEKRPELSLGQLLAGGVMVAAPDRLALAHLLRIGDTELAEAVERFVLLDAPAPLGEV